MKFNILVNPRVEKVWFFSVWGVWIVLSIALIFELFCMGHFAERLVYLLTITFSTLTKKQNWRCSNYKDYWRGSTSASNTHKKWRSYIFWDFYTKNLIKSRDYHTIGECSDWLKINTWFINVLDINHVINDMLFRRHTWSTNSRF